jgi:hypothetical protein
VVAFPPELDIVVWAVKAETVSKSSDLARDIFSEAARQGLHLALAELPARIFWPQDETLAADATIVCLRSVVMKPEHAGWMDRIVGILDQAAHRSRS